MEEKEKGSIMEAVKVWHVLGTRHVSRQENCHVPRRIREIILDRDIIKG